MKKEKKKKEGERERKREKENLVTEEKNISVLSERKMPTFAATDHIRIHRPLSLSQPD